MYVLDTDVLIDVQRGHTPAVNWFAGLTKMSVRHKKIETSRSLGAQAARLPACASTLEVSPSLQLEIYKGLLFALARSWQASRLRSQPHVEFTLPSNTQQVREALKLVAPLPIIWPSEIDCHRALSDFTAYHLSHGLGLLDSLITACAIGLSAKLCTFNVKHYRSLPGLSLAQPYAR